MPLLDNPVIEPGLEPPKIRSHPAKASWLKVAITTIVVTVIAFLLFGIKAPRPRNDLRSAAAPVLTNATIWDPVTQHDLPIAYHKRDDWWSKKVKKGHWLVCLMNMEVDKVAPQAQWKDFTALAQEGWDLEQWTLDKPGDNPLMKVIRALKIRTALRIFDLSLLSTTPSDWTEMDHNHAASESDYQNLFNIHDGVLVVDFNYSPDYQIKTLGLDVEAPALKQWSDVVFLNWQELHRQAGSSDKQKRNIQRFSRIKIRNEETVETVRAAKNRGVRTLVGRPQAYPGWDFKIHEEAAEAIMGTAHGAGTAYFLVQHKAFFGLKGVDSIRAYDCSEDEDEFEMCLDSFFRYPF